MDGQDCMPHVLREYALVADGERGALIDPQGCVAWMCAPRWHDDAVFGGLIGGGGHCQVAPADPWHVWGGFYEPGTLIWHSRWTTRDTIVECREALALPADPHRVVLLRRILAVDDPVAMRIRCRIGPHEIRRDGVMRVDSLWVRWRGAVDVRLDDGRHHDFVLEVSDRPFDGPPPDPESCWQETEHRWRQAVPDCSDTLVPVDTAHAYAVLRGLTSATGGMVAAATTSLPERAKDGGDYDYRYAWIRDQCYVGQAVAAHGPHSLLDDAVRFVAERILEHGPDLRPAYTVTGGQIPDQRDLDLPGYPGGTDRVGNRVRRQFQLDAFGEALLLFAAAAGRDRLTPEASQAVGVVVDAIDRHWRRSDAGIWELEERSWTHSNLTCVAGLRRTAESTQTNRCSALADAILAETARTSLHPTGRWQRSPDDDAVDAALLLPALRGAVPADDPRTAATVRAVRDDLGRDGYVYRFRPDQRPLGAAEGAFLICGFWLALAEQQQGDAIAAARRFERNRAACGPPGLFTEEYDVGQRQLRGNLPQAFVHGMLLECSARLARDWSA
ncbi:glycoside hydrolase family 15 protein [Kutzneria sp. NPDC052558]|uniref:glycoside hydrolase family 15 protein n=1 Tax=Kutzneria sp. NPDC052558 TaxID=3364121 RepID=UPI0037C94597